MERDGRRWSREWVERRVVEIRYGVCVVKKKRDRETPGRVGRGWEAETRNHQVGNATGSAVGVLFASLSCPFSVGDGGPDEVSTSVAECLGVVGPFSFSSPGSDKSRLQLSTLPPPVLPKV